MADLNARELCASRTNLPDHATFNLNAFLKPRPQHALIDAKLGPALRQLKHAGPKNFTCVYRMVAEK
jgi:hypothetical protein